MAEDKNDDAPRQTYMPKPPSKDEVDQVSREQAMIADDWTGEPSAAESEPASGGSATPEPAAPPGDGDES